MWETHKIENERRHKSKMEATQGTERMEVFKENDMRQFHHVPLFLRMDRFSFIEIEHWR